MFSYEQISKFTDEQIQANEELLKDNKRFASLDEQDKIDTMKQYLYFSAIRKSEALGETVDENKKWKIFSKIKTRNFLDNILFELQSPDFCNFTGEQCLAELNGPFLPDFVYGELVGDTFSYRHSKGLNSYFKALGEDKNTDQFYENWNAETARLKEEAETRERNYREAEQRRQNEQKAPDVPQEDAPEITENVNADPAEPEKTEAASKQSELQDRKSVV